ncbi:MAG TPA: hypothetical protein VK726_06130 [Acetobacteraceae bacterium]|jgi:hypothetical protein|nr:hypothetical protein [Acetobacteraceae bacterium]
MVDSAMFDPVNAASGSPYQPANYTGGSVQGANANAAALQAALTVMTNLYINPSTSLYQQYVGQTGSSYFSSSVLTAHPGKSGDVVGPTTTQMASVTAEVNSVAAERSALGSGPSITAAVTLGTAAANAAIAVNNASGSQAAMLVTRPSIW